MGVWEHLVLSTTGFGDHLLANGISTCNVCIGCYQFSGPEKGAPFSFWFAGYFEAGTDSYHMLFILASCNTS